MRAALGVAFFLAVSASSSGVEALHKTDHRFSVEGLVCGPDGKPIQDEQVIVKDTRTSVSATAFTDDDGYYKATLHLHNDNAGDPLLVTVQDNKQETRAQFDPKDRETERSIEVNFGSGCEAAGPPPWLYYGAAISVAVLVAVGVAGAVKRRRRRFRKKGKGRR